MLPSVKHVRDVINMNVSVIHTLDYMMARKSDLSQRSNEI